MDYSDGEVVEADKEWISNDSERGDFPSVSVTFRTAKICSESI